ncbi:MAG: nucleotidyltransferase family protein [Deltaproteobacteria bacterium]|nr:nucleotidyltransferase family protein [Deltaproteobacteria bacterium]
MTRSPLLSTQLTVATLRPEVEVLLCCARTRMDATRRERMTTLLQEDLNWQNLIQLAQRHGVTPLLYRSLHASWPEAVPKTIMDQLQHNFQKTVQRNRFLSEELLKLLTLFATHGLPALPYKGPVLAATAYGDVALRKFGDLDLLIDKRDFHKAKELLMAQGYRPEVAGAQEANLLHSEYHFSFFPADSRATLELHWEVAWRYWAYPLEFERLWDRAVSVSFAGGTVASLRPEDALLILCIHGGKHQWERLLWICDIAESIHAHHMDWSRLLRQAQMRGSQRTLLLGLFLAQDLLGAELPEEVRQNIQADAKIKLLAKQVTDQLFTAAQALGKEGENRPTFYRTVFYLHMRERLWDKAQFFLHYPFVRNFSILSQRLRNLLKHPTGT